MKSLDYMSKEIVEYYGQTKNMSLVVEKFHISRDGARAVLKRAGVSIARDYSKSRPREWVARSDEIVALYREIGSALEVSKRLGCNFKTVLTILQKAGIERPRNAGVQKRIEKESGTFVASYQEGKTISDISRETGRARCTISKILKKHIELPKIIRAPAGTWIKREIEILDAYEELQNAQSVSDKLHCAHTTVLKILHRNHVPINYDCMGFEKIYECNESFFENVDNQIKAYWLGFIAADGWVGDSRFSVFLQSRDESHIQKLKEDIGWTGPIYTDASDGCKGIAIGRVEVIRHLHNFGFTHLKTYEMTWDAFPEYFKNDSELVRHFIRGFFDGDGHIHIGRQSNMGACCFNNHFLAYIQNFIEGHVKIHGCLRQANPRLSTIRYNNRQALAVADFLYKDAQRYLPRKCEKYLELKTFYANKPPRKSTVPFAEQIIQYYKEVHNTTMVAEKFGFTASNIKNVLNKNGIATSRDYSATRTHS